MTSSHKEFLNEYLIGEKLTKLSIILLMSISITSKQFEKLSFKYLDSKQVNKESFLFSSTNLFRRLILFRFSLKLKACVNDHLYILSKILLLSVFLC